MNVDRLLAGVRENVQDFEWDESGEELFERFKDYVKGNEDGMKDTLLFLKYYIDDSNILAAVTKSARVETVSFSHLVPSS